MCSIAGKVSWATPAEATAQKAREELLTTIFTRSEERGRDSWGIVTPTFSMHEVGAFTDYHKSIPNLGTAPGWLLANFRAEPTTEYIEDKTVEDIQPFIFNGWAVAHNGTLANDKELYEKYHLPKAETTIDSAVIPRLINSAFDSKASLAEVATFLYQELKGSYALAIAHQSRPKELLLMCNYKPLFVTSKNALFLTDVYFASLPEYFDAGDVARRLSERRNVVEIPAFHAMVIEPKLMGLEPTLIDLREEERAKNRVLQSRKKRVLVVASGGLDSTVAATWAVDQGWDVALLHFEYHCRAEAKEIEAIEAIAKRLGCKLIQIPTNIFTEVIGGSSLTTDLDKEITRGDVGVEYAHEWVPARNLIMLSIATGVAEAHGYDAIILGNNLEESGAYPDNEMMFIRKLNAVMPYAVNVDKRVEILMPVGNLMKHEIVKLGMEIDAPLDLCWSCYEAGDIHCGSCGPCTMRKTAFAMNKIADVIPYSE